MTSQKTYIVSMIIATLITVGVISASIIFTTPKQVDSAVSDNLSGYAWSDNIGWISFNCTDTGAGCGSTNYGVTVAANGDMSGYAWSENIGWISFKASDVASCPGGTCQPHFDKATGVMTGWARALSACQTTTGVPATSCSGAGAGAASSGWDGWISFNCSNTGTCGTSNYETKAVGANWGGYAWGSDVVGWISLSGPGYGVVGTQPPSIQESPSCEAGSTPANATQCSSAPAPSAANTPRNGVSSCTVAASNCQFECNVNYIVDGTGKACRPTQCSDGVDNDGNDVDEFGAPAVLIDMADPGCSGLSDDSELNTLPTLSVSPVTVEVGSNATLTWNLMGNVGCTLSGGGKNFDVSSGVSSSTPVYARTPFTLTCPGGGVVTKTVDILPRGTET